VARHAPGARSAAPASLVLLLAYGVAFASAALGRSTPAFDDHPGQLYRIWHVVTLGPAPWAWNWGWWTGYPELQFYPPGFAYAGALLHVASLGVLTVDDAYLALVWLAYLAPGVIAWLALARALGNGWLALPGAFVVLTLSLWPGLASGVEGGVHVGMTPARLGWALVPLLALALARWSDGDAQFPIRSVVPLTAAIVLVHPAHLPAALVLVALAAVAGRGRARRAAMALGGLGVAALVTAFWTLPLLARLEDTRALAWGALTPESLVATFGVHPLAIVLTTAALAAPWLARTPYEQVLARAPWVMAVVVGVDAMVLEARGLAWLPADRVMDGFWLTLTLAAGVSAGRLVERLAGTSHVRRPIAALAVIGAVIGVSLVGRDTLSLWPRASDWPTYAETERGLRLPALWSVLRDAPEGRVLFVRSGVPLVYGPQWWRPHTHVTALTPLTTGRAIVNGTFTHPSPVAALLYRGDAGRGPITRLVEQLDGHALFGQPLESLDAAAFNTHARRLGVSVVVALDEDLPRLTALTDNPLFSRRQTEPPFVIWLGAPAPLPHPLEAGPWRLPVTTASEGWTSLPVAYYPLWRATAGGVPLETRRGPFSDLEVRLPGATTTVDLSYHPGLVEGTGVALTVVGLLAWLLSGRRWPGSR
jgi:hypothetical protein